MLQNHTVLIFASRSTLCLCEGITPISRMGRTSRRELERLTVKYSHSQDYFFVQLTPDIPHILWLGPNQVSSKMEACPVFLQVGICGRLWQREWSRCHFALPSSTRSLREITLLLFFFIVVFKIPVLIFQFFAFFFVPLLDLHNSLTCSFLLSFCLTVSCYLDRFPPLNKFCCLA